MWKIRFMNIIHSMKDSSVEVDESAQIIIMAYKSVWPDNKFCKKLHGYVSSSWVYFQHCRSFSGSGVNEMLGDKKWKEWMFCSETIGSRNESCNWCVHCR